MDSNLQQYYFDLERETEALVLQESCSREKAFTIHTITEIAQLIDCGDIEMQHCELNSSNGSILGEIHAYALSSNKEVLSLFYSLYDASGSVKTKSATDVQQSVNRMQGIFNKAIRGLHFDLRVSDPTYDFCKMVYENVKTIATIKFYVVSNCIIVGAENRKFIIANKPVFPDVWDLKKLQGNLSTSSDHYSINLDFKNQDSQYRNYKIPFIEMQSERCQYKCILAMFPAKLLYKLYEQYNTQLLQNNVRYFLGFKKTKTKTANSGMRDTLKDDDKKEMFLAYNNGITAIAKNVITSKIKDEDITDKSDISDISRYISMGVLECIEDFRIVNGGQTTASIFYTAQKDKMVSLQGVFVQVKLIITKDEKEVPESIARFSNSQSQIKLSDFSVSNILNTELEKLSRNITIPSANHEVKYWFFERLRGQYDVLRSEKKTKAEIAWFDSAYPKYRKFKKEEVAKVWKSWEGEPYDAVKGEATNYDSYYQAKVKEKFIPDEDYYKKTIALIIIYKYLLSRKENKNYSNGKASVVCYSLAYLNNITFGKIDLMKIWNNQCISDGLKEFLDGLCDNIYKALDELALSVGKTILSYGKTSSAFKNVLNKDIKCDLSSISDDMIH